MVLILLYFWVREKKGAKGVYFVLYCEGDFVILEGLDGSSREHDSLPMCPAMKSLKKPGVTWGEIMFHGIRVIKSQSREIQISVDW